MDVFGTPLQTQRFHKIRVTVPTNISAAPESFLNNSTTLQEFIASPYSLPGVETIVAVIIRPVVLSFDLSSPPIFADVTSCACQHPLTTTGALA